MKERQIITGDWKRGDALRGMATLSKGLECNADISKRKRERSVLRQ
ncbi:MAG: hypothetical protein LC676_05760 [Loktanella sp.]|nr:hypothetical protein [Loktanella sp.]